MKRNYKVAFLSFAVLIATLSVIPSVMAQQIWDYVTYHGELPELSVTTQSQVALDGDVIKDGIWAVGFIVNPDTAKSMVLSTLSSDISHLFVVDSKEKAQQVAQWLEDSTNFYLAVDVNKEIEGYFPGNDENPRLFLFRDGKYLGVLTWPWTRELYNNIILAAAQGVLPYAIPRSEFVAPGQRIKALRFSDSESIESGLKWPREKKTLLIFADMYCLLCVAGIDEYLQLSMVSPSSVDVFVISANSEKSVNEHLGDLGWQIQAFYDSNEESFRAMGIYGVPTLVLVDEYGDVLKVQVGANMNFEEWTILF